MEGGGGWKWWEGGKEGYNLRDFYAKRGEEQPTGARVVEIRRTGRAPVARATAAGEF